MKILDIISGGGDEQVGVSVLMLLFGLLFMVLGFIEAAFIGVVVVVSGLILMMTAYPSTRALKSRLIGLFSESHKGKKRINKHVLAFVMLNVIVYSLAIIGFANYPNGPVEARIGCMFGLGIVILYYLSVFERRHEFFKRAWKNRVKREKEKTHIRKKEIDAYVERHGHPGGHRHKPRE